MARLFISGVQRRGFVTADTRTDGLHQWSVCQHGRRSQLRGGVRAALALGAGSNRHPVPGAKHAGHAAGAGVALLAAGTTEVSSRPTQPALAARRPGGGRAGPGDYHRGLQEPSEGTDAARAGDRDEEALGAGAVPHHHRAVHDTRLGRHHPGSDLYSGHFPGDGLRLGRLPIVHLAWLRAHLQCCLLCAVCERPIRPAASAHILRGRLHADLALHGGVPVLPRPGAALDWLATHLLAAVATDLALHRRLRLRLRTNRLGSARRDLSESRAFSALWVRRAGPLRQRLHLRLGFPVHPGSVHAGWGVLLVRHLQLPWSAAHHILYTRDQESAPGDNRSILCTTFQWTPNKKPRGGKS